MNKPPKDDARYAWTSHVWTKMRQYGISESRIKRIIRFPKRREVGIAEGTVAVMQPSNPVTAGGVPTWRQEIWVMYKLEMKKGMEKLGRAAKVFASLPQARRIKVITAWRYPGISPKRDPVPHEIIEEVQRLL